MFNQKEYEFEDLKSRVSEHLKWLADKDSEIVNLKSKLSLDRTEITEKDVKIKGKFQFY